MVKCRYPSSSHYLFQQLNFVSGFGLSKIITNRANTIMYKNSVKCDSGGWTLDRNDKVSSSYHIRKNMKLHLN